MIPYYPVAVAVLATALLLALEHWIVYAVRQSPLPPPVNYAVGSATVWSGFTLWGVLSGDLLPAVVLGAIYLVAGGLLVLMHLTESARDGQGYHETSEHLTTAMRDADDPRL